MLKVLKSNKGLTLIEVVVSIAILAMIVIPLSSMFITTARVSSDTRDMMSANQLAQEYMEKIKAVESLTPYFGINTEYPVVNGREYTVQTTVAKYGSYTKNLGNEPEEANYEINASSGTQSLQIDESNNVTYNGLSILPSNPIVDKIIISTIYKNSPTINVTNLSTKPLHLYIIESTVLDSGDVIGTATVNTIQGNVTVYKNMHSGAPAGGFSDWVYQITVKVFKGHSVAVDDKLTELTGLKRME